MKWYRRVFAGLLGIGLLAPPVLAQGSDQPAAPPIATAQPADQTRSTIEAIRQAPDPSSAVAAYAREAATNPNDSQLLDAYVSKMVAFGLPDVAYQQAQRLVDVDPNNGLAWAVLAYMAAKQGQMAEALADLAQAGNRAPDNRFVQETAGQLLAWHDQNKPAVSDSLRDSLERVRQAMASQQAFVDAYRDAQQDLKHAGSLKQGRSQQGQPTYASNQTPLWPAPETVFPNQYSYTPFRNDYSDLYGYGYSGLGYDNSLAYLGYGLGYYPSYPYGTAYSTYGYGYGFGSGWPCWGAGWGCWPFWGGPSWWWGRNNNFVFNFGNDHHHGKFSLADLLHNNRFLNGGLSDRGRYFGDGGVRSVDRTRSIARGNSLVADRVQRAVVTRDGLQARGTSAGAIRGVDRSMRIFRSGDLQPRLTFSQPNSGTAIRRSQVALGASGTRGNTVMPQRQATTDSGISVLRGGNYGPMVTGPNQSGQGEAGLRRLEVTPQIFGSGGGPQAVPRVSVVPRGGFGMGGSVARPAAPQSFSYTPGPSMSVPRYSPPARSFAGGGAPAAPSYSGGFSGGVPRGGGFSSGASHGGGGGGGHGGGGGGGHR